MPPSDESATAIIIDAWRQGRPIVPFLGSGISIAAGFPTITRLTEYLAKMLFALQNGIYKSRYPVISSGVERAEDRYRRRPADFVADFGWPDIGQLNADIWAYTQVNGGIKPDTIVQQELYRLLNDAEPSVRPPVEVRKQVLEALIDKVDDDTRMRLQPIVTTLLQPTDSHRSRLRGDWSTLLDQLCEGHLDLIDSLFIRLDHRRLPTRVHIFLTFLTQLMGIRLLLSTNFDTLLEQAMQREGIVPRVFDIHRDTDPPHIHLVRQQLSLVKLHGSAYGLRFGERLQYSLDEAARQRICGYLPDNALVVVLGFSGGERRMMEVIGDFARRQAAISGTPQVLWLATSPENKLSRYVKDLRLELDNNNLGRAFVYRQICDSNSFLPGLFFKIASGFPASRHKYEALVSRPSRRVVVPAASDKLSEVRSPALVLFSDDDPKSLLNTPTCFPSSWASLAASDFVQRHRDRDILWIDLENHHTVEAVIRDILAQIRKVDPDAPQLALPTQPGQITKKGFVKPIERIREALLRGRFCLVFDSLDSFSRPPLVHHGMPHFEAKCSSFLEPLAERVHGLCDFFCMLLGVDGAQSIVPPLHDTIVVFTMTAPGGRHEADKNSDNPCITALQVALSKLLLEDLSADSIHKSSAGQQHNLKYFCFTKPDLATLPCTQESERHDLAAMKFRAELAPYRDFNQSQPWVNLFADTAAFRNRHRLSHEPSEPTDDGKLGLLAILSLFRRPRSLATVRSLFARWLFDPGDLHADRLLTSSFESIDRTLRGLEAINAVESQEGENIFIPRQVHETVYDSLTTVVRLRSAAGAIGSIDGMVTVLISGLLASTWHLQVSRAYFADVYLPSHDDQAFFEFIYHRIAALRYLALLQTVVDSNAAQAEQCLTTINELLKARAQSRPRNSTLSPRHLPKDSVDTELVAWQLIGVKFAELADALCDIGSFSFIRRDHALDAALRAQNTSSPGPEQAWKALSLVIYHIRRHGLETLHNAFSREQQRISATTTPDTWLGWINHILDFELVEISGEWARLKDMGRIPDRTLQDLSEASGTNPEHVPFKIECRLLRQDLIELKLRLLRSKLDYDNCGEIASWEIAKVLVNGQAPEPSRASILELKGYHDEQSLTGAINNSVAWQQTIDFMRSDDTSGHDKIHLMRLWCEYARAIGGNGYVLATQCLFRKMRDALRPAAKGTDVLRLTTRRLLRMRNQLLRAGAEQSLNRVPVWKYFDDPTVSVAKAIFGRSNPMAVERETHELEDFDRTWSESATEYATGRSHNLAVRARALYLRGQYREAHRILTSSLSDVGDHTDSDRFARAVTHLYRAELMAMSAHSHLRQAGDVTSSLRKLDTALESLDSAARWLEPAAHRPIWWLRLYVGRAQIRHEQLLLEIRRLDGRMHLDESTYARRCLWLEECALDALKALRLALDTIPFTPEFHDENLRYNRPLIRAEEKVLAMWIQLFIAAFGYNHLLVSRLQLPHLTVREGPNALGWYEYYSWTEARLRDLAENQLRPLLEALTPHGFWKDKWGPWCELRQFNDFANDPCGFALHGDQLSQKLRSHAGVGGSKLPGGAVRSLREDLIDIERSVITGDKLHHQLWDRRRRVVMP